jgi:hypothetical protein
MFAETLAKEINGVCGNVFFFFCGLFYDVNNIQKIWRQKIC